MLKKASQKGFTIVELLIVIVVIGILAALVLNTFAGVQQRARNTERQTDVKAIASQLEAYYANEGNYPLFSEIDAEPELTAVLQGIDPGAAQAPGEDGFSLTSTATPGINGYGYIARTNAPDPAPACTVATDCQTFTLYYTTEGDPQETISVNSLN